MTEPPSNSNVIAPTEGSLDNGSLVAAAMAPRYAAMTDQQARTPRTFVLDPGQQQQLLQQTLTEMAQKNPAFLPAFLQQRELTAAAAFGPFGFHNPFAFAGFNPMIFANTAPLVLATPSNGAPSSDAGQEEARQANSVASDAYQRGREDTILSLVRAGGMASLPGLVLPTGSQPGTGMSAIGNTGTTMGNTFGSTLGDTHATGTGGMKSEEFLISLGSNCLERRTNNVAYFDASTLTDPDPVVVANRRTRGGVTEPFPEKLHRMIREAEKNGKQDVISFFHHGRSFAIHKPERFCSEIMSKYFKQSRLSSFQRQLNLYGFTRINSGPDAGGYYHELFLKGRPALSIHVCRVGVPQATPRRRGVKAHDSMKTPDFYSIPPITLNDKDSAFFS